jgi:Flp pilus assembly protein TadD
MNNNTLGAKFVFLLFVLMVWTVICAVAQSPDVYFEKGRQKAMNGELTEAIQDFTLAANFNPNNPEIYNARGIAYEKLGDYASAQADYERAMRLNPDSALALHNLRNLAAKMQSKGITVETGHYSNDSLRSQPAAQTTYQQPAAQTTYQQPAAQTTYQQPAAQTTYQQPAAQTTYQQPAAQTMYQQPVAQTTYQQPAAQTMYQQPAAISTSVYSSLPASLPKTNLSGQTSNTVNQMWASTPGSPPRFTAAGSQRYQTAPAYPYDSVFRQTPPAQTTGQTNEGYYSPLPTRTRPQTVNKPVSRTRIPALSALDQQIFIDPIAESYNFQGAKLNEYGRFNEAVSQFNEAIKAYPEYAIAYNNRGVAFANIGDFSSAVVDFNQALRLNPYYRDAQFNRERVLELAGNWVAQR